MKCIVIDDEPLAREGMKTLIEKVPFLKLEGSFSNVMEADHYLQNNPVDLIFLDIEMPELSGFDFLKQKSTNSHVIITTAYPNYALEGYEYEITDYLMKPIKFDRFYKAISKTLFQVENKQSENSGVEKKFVFIRSNKKYVKIISSEINYIKGLKDYSIVSYHDECYPVAYNLKNIENKLNSSDLFRINKSYIINIKKIESFNHNYIYIKGNEIPIGTNYKDELLDRLGPHILKK